MYKIPQENLDKMVSRPAAHIEYVVIHHTVMHKTCTILDVAEEEKPNGWLAVGYNYYFGKRSNGEWVGEAGRPLDKKPAAQYGLNDQGYAIAIGGQYQPGAESWTDTVEEAALIEVIKHIEWVKTQCPNLQYLIGHRDVAAIAVQSEGGVLGDYSTQCPGDLLYRHLPDLRKITKLKAQP